MGMTASKSRPWCSCSGLRVGWQNGTHLRRFNRQDLTQLEFVHARVDLRDEVLHGSGMGLLSVTDPDVLDGITLVDQHNLNSSDGAILACFLRFAHSQAPGSPACLLIASDQRLLRAAQLEGLGTLNPERLPTADVPAFLAAL